VTTVLEPLIRPQTKPKRQRQANLDDRNEARPTWVMGGYFWRPDRAIVGLYKPKRRYLIARCRRQICSKLRSKRYRNTAANHAEVVLRASNNISAEVVHQTNGGREAHFKPAAELAHCFGFAAAIRAPMTSPSDAKISSSRPPPPKIAPFWR